MHTPPETAKFGGYDFRGSIVQSVTAALGANRWQRCSGSRDWHLRLALLREGHSRHVQRCWSDAFGRGRTRYFGRLPRGCKFRRRGRSWAATPRRRCVVGSVITSGTTRFMTDWNWSRNLLRAIPGAVYGPIVGVSAPIAQP